jgi:putative membrane protein insertion efficiency factor
MKKIALFLIRLYQKTLSPDHGPTKGLHKHGFCRFYPTCSQYTYDSIEKFGFVRGSLMGGWRILRCNPFNKGGNDPVPKNFTDAFKSHK